MSTRSAIGVQHGNVIKAVYCHSDGYLSYNGRVLLAHYSGEQTHKASQLVALGDMSMLGRDIGEKIDFNARMSYTADNIATQCRFYGRDRDETGTEFSVFHSDRELFENIDAEFFYVLKNDVWHVSTGGAWSLLSEAVAQEFEQNT